MIASHLVTAPRPFNGKTHLPPVPAIARDLSIRGRVRAAGGSRPRIHLTFGFRACIEVTMFEELKEKVPAVDAKLRALRRHL